MKEQGKIIEKVTAELQDLPFIEAIVLGGSRATGTAAENSDIDIGIYYDPAALDLPALNAAAKELDDLGRDDLVCGEGGWGNWVNCGGWLSIGGQHVDLILRDWTRVLKIIQMSDRGEFSCHYQTGHPHAYVDVMYRGELAECRTLYAKSDAFSTQKARAQVYPVALKKAIADFFLFEAGFSCGFAENYAGINDASYIAGNVFRSVSALCQALFAMNGKWLLNEKRAVTRAAELPICPERLRERVDEVYAMVVSQPEKAAALLRTLCADAEALRMNG